MDSLTLSIILIIVIILTFLFIIYMFRFIIKYIKPLLEQNSQYQQLLMKHFQINENIKSNNNISDLNVDNNKQDKQKE